MKEIIKCLKSILTYPYRHSAIWKKDRENEIEERVDQAEAEIKKIVLGWVGEDKYDPTKVQQPDYADDYKKGKVIGYNQRGAEIRKKVEGEL